VSKITGSVYLGLGTNLGERAANLQAAARALEPAVRVLRASRLYETPPWGYEQQPDFLNQVLESSTDLNPQELLAYVKRLEVELGRQPGVRYGPRLIDIDILLYGAEIVDLPDLVIPHPRLAERAFMLRPLVDLAPDLRHPLLGKTIAELLAGVDASGIRLIES
jgi:2-amino-4-hydroxy-6-hydroxymethyldihydropteridine diphosphokinase